MKIAITSDIHLEFGDWYPVNPENADVLILSGDIMTANEVEKAIGDPNEIIDYKGAVLFRLLNPESGIRIPTNQFIKGAYLVRLTKDEKSLTKRLLVN